MTHRPAWLADKITLRGDHAREHTCPRCGALVLVARAGRTAALDVTADPQPLRPLDEVHALLEGRMTWHLVTGALGTRRITWRDIFAIRAGPARHPVLRDHRCPPPAQGAP
ncbi:hypothetical protein ABGB09_29570 [Streptomyces sp. B8F3]|uniref:hypothetical protein n=1 Tax=Streptomyces sp. B8F3 TaxID=3153573 RepID=UPI00325E8F01